MDVDTGMEEKDRRSLASVQVEIVCTFILKMLTYCFLLAIMKIEVLGESAPRIRIVCFKIV